LGETLSHSSFPTTLVLKSASNRGKLNVPHWWSTIRCALSSWAPRELGVFSIPQPHGACACQPSCRRSTGQKSLYISRLPKASAKV